MKEQQMHQNNNIRSKKRKLETLLNDQKTVSSQLNQIDYTLKQLLRHVENEYQLNGIIKVYNDNRSDDMFLYKVFIQKDNAWEIMNKIGQQKGLHFIDLNKDEQTFNLTYQNHLKLREDAQRRLLFIKSVCKRFSVNIQSPQTLEDFYKANETIRKVYQKTESTVFEQISNELEEKERFLTKQMKEMTSMEDNLTQVIDYKNVLEAITSFVLTTDSLANKIKQVEDATEPLLSEALIGQITGTINAQDQMRFKRLVFRVSQGKALVQIKDMSQKQIYLLSFPEGPYLRQKLTKVADSFLGNRYEIPYGGIMMKVNELEKNIIDLTELVNSTKQQITEYLISINKINEERTESRLEVLKWYITKDQLIYKALNQLHFEGNSFVGLFWSYQSMKEIKQLKEELLSMDITGLQLEQVTKHTLEPPTYFKTNDFFSPFQEIVNTYGIPSYQEINPGVFTCVTFPFLFGVMFGDVGHGFLMFIIGSFLCLFNGSLKRGDSFLKMLLPARYMFTLMGLFAMYCGLIYNDFMSMPLEWFGKSCYQQTPLGIQKPICTYTFGIDPKWYLATNELTFQNSLKMKLSVILGIIQMSFGIIIKALNAIYFKNNIDLFCEFVPQIILLISLFGYMDFLIVMKWLIPWHSMTDGNPPSVITTMINIPLAGGIVPGTPFFGTAEFNSQISILLFCIAGVCVPIMLMVKPLILLSQTKNNAHQYKAINDDYDDTRQQNIDDVLHEQQHQPHAFGEIMIHQLIETIEFVLGSISNTASYLRLWALSLAHSQLAKVFFDNLMEPSFESPIALFFAFLVYASATIGVLMCMDAMECFLHTLRLHWVEFQNKFYKGTGYLFQPLSFDERTLSQN